ncbi:MAG TPA: rhodanese-like domain-containing protein [Arenicellales bacterium]|nr:rhodanese-like domain-containing protein [Arenicellales bacterium]
MFLWRIAAAALAALLLGPAGAAHNEPISAGKLAARLDEGRTPVILDVRTEWEYRSGHVPGALHIPHTELAARLSDISADPGEEIVVYCEQGPRAEQAEAILEKAGFDGARTLRGHMSQWRAGDYPVQR